MELLDRQAEDAVHFEDDAHTILKQGFLRKKKTRGLRFFRPRWQVRYFVADNRAKVLRYTVTEDGGVRGALPFRELRRVELSRGVAGGTQLELELVPEASNGNQGRVFYLQADDPREADAWVQVLSSQIPGAKAKTASTNDSRQTKLAAEKQLSINTTHEHIQKSDIQSKAGSALREESKTEDSSSTNPNGRASPKVHSPPAIPTKLHVGAKMPYRSLNANSTMRRNGNKRYGKHGGSVSHSIGCTSCFVWIRNQTSGSAEETVIPS